MHEIVYRFPNNVISTKYTVISLNPEIIHGQYKEFFDNEQLKCKIEFNNGKKDGIYEEFNKNGNLIKICKYENDKLIGKYKEFFPNKKIKLECFYDIPGRLHGDYKVYKDAGKILQYKYEYHLEMHKQFYKGKKYGTWVVYNSAGRIEQRLHFKNDQLHGQCIMKNNGTELNIADYNHGNIITEMIVIEEDHKIKRIQKIYKNNVLKKTIESEEDIKTTLPSLKELSNIKK